jgi:hypothetical protein
MLFRLARTPAPSVRSLRRPLEHIVSVDTGLESEPASAGASPWPAMPAAAT